jgi:hypothetical protein
VKSKFCIKRLAEALHRFMKDRQRVIKLGFAFAMALFLSGILLGLIMVQFAPSQPVNHQTEKNDSSAEVRNQGEIQIPDNSSDSSQTASNNETNENGNIFVTIGVSAYWDSELTDRVNDINELFLSNGTQKSYKLYIFNEGNTGETLSLSTSNWNPPEASSYITLTWNYGGQVINPNTAVPVTLTLTVSPNITEVTYFNFNIIVEARN